MKNQKQEIITFKVPESLRNAMKGIPNRSEFIRHAVLAALGSICPLCRGTGVLLPHQKNHWDQFSVDHRLEECDACHAMHLVCSNRAQATLNDSEFADVKIVNFQE
ncbi:MAG: ribbon-helix-helix domain-containing protein [Desulfomonilaceae bacterium]